MLADLIGLSGIADGAQHILDRQATAGAGKRRRREDEGLHARILVQQILDFLLGLRRPSSNARDHSLSLKPTKPLPPPSMPAIRKLSSISGIFSPARVNSSAKSLRVVDRRILRRVDEAQICALILFRREFGRRLHEQEHGRAEKRRDDD